MSVWGVCLCCMCVIMEMCPYLQRATVRSGLPPSVSRCHMCVSFYFCFALLCVGSNCSVYSRRTGLGISEPFCLPSHCRRAGIAEACYHIGSGDRTLVLRLCSPHLFTFWASPSLQLGWFCRWKAERSCPDSWCLNQLLGSTNPPISWDCLCYPELRKHFFYRLVWRLSFKFLVCARIYMNLQVLSVCTHWKSQHLSEPQFLHLWNRITTYLANPWEAEVCQYKITLNRDRAFTCRTWDNDATEFGDVVMGLSTAAKAVVQELHFPGTRLAGTSYNSCYSSSKTLSC